MPHYIDSKPLSYVRARRPCPRLTLCVLQSVLDLWHRKRHLSLNGSVSAVQVK